MFKKSLSSITKTFTKTLSDLSTFIEVQDKRLDDIAEEQESLELEMTFVADDKRKAERIQSKIEDILS